MSTTSRAAIDPVADRFDPVRDRFDPVRHRFEGAGDRFERVPTPASHARPHARPVGSRRRMRLAAALVGVGVAALAGCEAAEREPDVLQDTTPGEAGIQDRTDPSEGAVVAEPGTRTPGATTTAASDTVDVTLVDYEIRMPSPIESGPVTFRIVNEGTVVHGFEVEGQGQEWAVEEIQPGESAHLTANLTAGSWEVYCPVGDHAEARGMEMTLQVESPS